MSTRLGSYGPIIGLRIGMHKQEARDGRGVFSLGKARFRGNAVAWQENVTKHGGKRPAKTVLCAVNTGSKIHSVLSNTIKDIQKRQSLI